MHSNNPRLRRYPPRQINDSDPIIFPKPVISTRPAVYPPNFEPASDIIIDPYGNIFCFVCQVSVPKGAANISQHLEGKKHENNNRRFTSAQHKQHVRMRYVNASILQREHVPAHADDPSSAPGSTSAPGSAFASATSVKEEKEITSVVARPVARGDSIAYHGQTTPNPRGNPKVEPRLEPSSPSGEVSGEPREERVMATKEEPRALSTEVSGDTTGDQDGELQGGVTHSEERQLSPRSAAKRVVKKAMREELMKKFEECKIDKAAFIKSLVGDDDKEENGGEDEDFKVNLEFRQGPFGPLNFSAPEGPDYFLESMAAETEPTKAAGNIRKLLDNRVEGKENEKLSISAEGVTNGHVDGKELKAKTEHTDEVEEFIKISDDNDDGVSKEPEAEREMELEKEAMVILKDTNDEELPPWLLDRDAAENVLFTSDSSVSLHFELLQFSNFMSPTEDELNSRNEMVMMVDSIVRSIWPKATAVVFGSYATGLYLPTSDVDICVTGTPKGGVLEEFEQLAEAVRNVSGFARRVHVIKAKVPLVKIISKKTSMNCDICIGNDNGPKVVPLIKRYLADYPAIRPILLVVKSFLKQRNLNEVFTGVQVKDNGSYYDKFEKYSTLPQETMRFSIEDPNDETNELGKTSFATMRIRKAFGNASMTLIKWRRDDSTATPTPLGAVLHYDDSMRFRRGRVIADMERKGLSPLRVCVSETGTIEKRVSGLPSRRSNAKKPVGAEQISHRRNGGGSANKRSFSTVQNNESDPRDRGSQRSLQRDPRDRDPRLAKRHRGNLGQESERPRLSLKPQGIYTPGHASHGRTVLQNNQNQVSQLSRVNQVNGGVQNSGNALYPPAETNFNQGMPYGAQAQSGYSEYPPQAFPVSTPGYQYVEQQPTYASSSVMPPAMYQNTGFAAYPQQPLQQLPEGGAAIYPNNQTYNEQMYDETSRRGNNRKRGSFSRRESYRGR